MGARRRLDGRSVPPRGGADVFDRARRRGGGGSLPCVVSPTRDRRDASLVLVVCDERLVDPSRALRDAPRASPRGVSGRRGLRVLGRRLERARVDLPSERRARRRVRPRVARRHPLVSRRAFSGGYFNNNYRPPPLRRPPPASPSHDGEQMLWNIIGANTLIFAGWHAFDPRVMHANFAVSEESITAEECTPPSPPRSAITISDTTRRT